MKYRLLVECAVVVCVEDVKSVKVTRTKLTNIGNDYNTLFSKYRYLVLQWSEMKQQPEFIEAMLRVEKRKQEETAVKREEQAKQSRRQSIIDRFIDKGHDALKSFSKTGRIYFNEQEVNAIYYGIVAIASKHNLPLDSAKVYCHVFRKSGTCSIFSEQKVMLFF